MNSIEAEFNAKKLDNPDHSYAGDLMAEELYSQLKSQVGEHVSPYQDFNSTNLTRANIDNDKLFNKILRDEILQAPVTNADATSGLTFSANKMYYILLDSTLHSLDFLVDIMMNPTKSFYSTSNYAVRLHNFDGYANGDAHLVYSIVDVSTGVEHYRAYYDHEKASTQVVASYHLRTMRRVTNGIVDKVTPLTNSDYFNIISCIPVKISNYSYWDNYVAATRNQVSPQDAAKAILQFQQDRATLPFKDGVLGNIDFLGPRVLAIDKPEGDQGNYIVGWKFLPFNNTVYNLFDFNKQTYIGPSPWTSENLITIIKLIALGIIGIEIIGMIARGQLSIL